MMSFLETILCIFLPYSMIITLPLRPLLYYFGVDWFGLSKCKFRLKIWEFICSFSLFCDSGGVVKCVFCEWIQCLYRRGLQYPGILDVIARDMEVDGRSYSIELWHILSM